MKLIFIDIASFIMYFYFLHYDDSHFERQSFIRASLLETIKKLTYITQFNFPCIVFTIAYLICGSSLEKCSLKLVVHKIMQNPWHAEERQLAHCNDGKDRYSSKTVLPLSFPSFFYCLYYFSLIQASIYFVKAQVGSIKSPSPPVAQQQILKFRNSFKKLPNRLCCAHHKGQNYFQTKGTKMQERELHPHEF